MGPPSWSKGVKDFREYRYIYKLPGRSVETINLIDYLFYDVEGQIFSK